MAGYNERRKARWDAKWGTDAVADVAEVEVEDVVETPEVVVDEVEEVEVEVEVVEDYSEMTYDELRDIASDMDIDGRSSMNKSELVEAIKAAE